MAGSAGGSVSPFQEHGLAALLEAAEAAPAAAEAGLSAELVDQTIVLQRHLDGMTVRGCPVFCQACAQALVLPGSEHGMPRGRCTALAPPIALPHNEPCALPPRADNCLQAKRLAGALRSGEYGRAAKMLQTFVCDMRAALNVRMF